VRGHSLAQLLNARPLILLIKDKLHRFHCIDALLRTQPLPVAKPRLKLRRVRLLPLLRGKLSLPRRLRRLVTLIMERSQLIGRGSLWVYTKFEVDILAGGSFRLLRRAGFESDD